MCIWNFPIFFFNKMSQILYENDIQNYEYIVFDIFIQTIHYFHLLYKKIQTFRWFIFDTFIILAQLYVISFPARPNTKYKILQSNRTCYLFSPRLKKSTKRTTLKCGGSRECANYTFGASVTHSPARPLFTIEISINETHVQENLHTIRQKTP